MSQQTNYMSIGEMSTSQTESDVAAVFPTNATLDRLMVFVEAGANGTYTVRVNGSDTAITCTIPSGANPPRCSDNTHTATISAGQTLSIKVTGANVGHITHFRLRYS